LEIDVPHYLSRVRINPQRTAARRLLSNPAQLRAAVLAGMPTQPVTRRVLWRLDNDAHRPLLYVVSAERPSFEHLVEQAGWPSAERPQFDVADYSTILERLQRGDRYSFRLAANPTYIITRKAADGTTRKQRAVHKTVEHQARWLDERADDLGLRLATSAMIDGQEDAPQPDLLVAGRTRHRFARKGSGTVTIDVVTYLGHLVVADPERLRAALVSGVGRAKGYGCGLLTIAPALSRAQRTA
jgi:CRISPR system Cascade subunit CasE